MQLFLGNIPHEAAHEDILKFCETVGPVFHLYTPQPKYEGAKNAGYAFAMYHSRVHAAEALEQLNGQCMPGGGSRALVRPPSYNEGIHV